MHDACHWKLLHGDQRYALCFMGELHETYKQWGFMQMKSVRGKSWRSPCWDFGLAASGEGRNAVALSVPLLLTCGEDKAFLFHFHEAPEMLKLERHRFQKPSWLIFVTSSGTRVATV